MLRLTGREPEPEMPAVRQDHPHPKQLERFLRGELPRTEAARVVRHLLRDCPACLQLTRRLWDLGDRAPLDVFDGEEQG